MTRREEDDAYPHVVACLDDRWRVIACRNDIQWILQRRSLKAGETRWRGERYHRTLSGLKSSLTAFSVDARGVAGLPERYPDGQRATQVEIREAA